MKFAHDGKRFEHLETWLIDGMNNEFKLVCWRKW